MPLRRPRRNHTSTEDDVTGLKTGNRTESPIWKENLDKSPANDSNEFPFPNRSLFMYLSTGFVRVFEGESEECCCGLRVS